MWVHSFLTRILNTLQSFVLMRMRSAPSPNSQAKPVAQAVTTTEIGENNFASGFRRISNENFQLIMSYAYLFKYIIIGDTGECARGPSVILGCRKGR